MKKMRIFNISVNQIKSLRFKLKANNQKEAKKMVSDLISSINIEDIYLKRKEKIIIVVE